MTQSWFCSDLHFGHKNIHTFREWCMDEEENRRIITDDWNEKVGKRDHVYVLGDACFTMETIFEFGELPGAKKWLIRGNHDLLDTQVYLKYFDGVYGLLKYKEFWLSHAPIHPVELRGRVNLHGHVHYNTIPDMRYFNCCPENLRETFKKGSHRPSLVSLDQIREYLKKCRLEHST